MLGEFPEICGIIKIVKKRGCLVVLSQWRPAKTKASANVERETVGLHLRGH